MSHPFKVAGYLRHTVEAGEGSTSWRTIFFVAAMGDTPIPTAHATALPEFPGEDFLAHAGSQWIEQAEARLTTCCAAAATDESLR